MKIRALHMRTYMRFFAPHENNMLTLRGGKIILKEVEEINKSKYGSHTH
jgi:hypothetical protein